MTTNQYTLKRNARRHIEGMAYQLFPLFVEFMNEKDPEWMPFQENRLYALQLEMNQKRNK